MAVRKRQRSRVPLLRPHCWGRALAVAGILVLLGAHSSENAAAGIYKWVDEAGKVHYGDRPPAGGDSESVQIEREDPAVEAAAQERSSKQKRLLEVMEVERKEREARSAERVQKRDDAERRSQQCKAAAKQLRELRDANWIWLEKEDGGRRILTAEERASAEEKLEASIARNCK